MLESAARALAGQLTREFLRNGNYEAAKASLDVSTLNDVVPASSVTDPSPLPDYGFAGLSIQSVGFTREADDEIVQVYVTRGNKRSLERLSKPIAGVEVKVTNLGRVIARPEAISATSVQGNMYERNERIACGSSCAPAGAVYSGTFGALVRSEGQFMALSNNHVFASCNQVPVGQPILSPSAMDARPQLLAPRELCRHSRIVELRTGTPALVPLVNCDASVARVIDPDEVSSWQGDDRMGYDTPVSTVDPAPHLRVKKVGRTTGVTVGTVEAQLLMMPLPYKYPNFTATVWFADIWTVKSEDEGQFALPGDSGSLVVTEDGTAAVGLLFATSPKGDYGMIAPINTVSNELNLTLVGNHGI